MRVNKKASKTIKILWWIQFWITVIPRALIFAFCGWTFIDDWDMTIVD